MKFNKKIVFTLLGVAALIAPLTFRSVAITSAKWKAHLALQAASAHAYPGLTAYQTEVLNSKLPPQPDKAPHNHRVLAIMGDGSHVEIKTIVGNGEVTREAVLPTHSWWGWDHLKSKSTFKHAEPRELLAGMFNPDADCITDYMGNSFGLQKVGEENILGWKAVKLSTTSSDRRMTQWRIPALGCFTAQIFMEYFDIKHPATPPTVVSTSLLKTDQIVPGAPDPKLFTAPDDAVERAPSEVTRMGYERSIRASGKITDEGAIQQEISNRMKKQEKYFADVDGKYRLAQSR